MEFSGDFYWVSKSTPPTPFDVENGQQLVTPSTVGENAFCAGLDQLGDALRDQTPEPDQSFALPDNTAQQAGCSTSLNTSGGTSLHCMWTFPYRADAASQAFESLQIQASTCAKETARQDQGVNHPDSYDLRLFEFAGSEVGVSLKDKGALQQTLVFLTFSAP